MPSVDKNLIRNQAPSKPHTKAERTTKVSAIQINPVGELTLQSQQPVVLSAIPLDAQGNAVHGLIPTWESSDKQVVFVTRDGQAVAGKPGKARLTASAGQKKESLLVTVTEGAKERFGGKKRDSKRELPAQSKKSGNPKIIKARWSPDEQGGVSTTTRFASLSGMPRPASMYLRPVEDDPLPDNETGSLYSPSNSVGSPPGRTTPGAPVPPAAVDGMESVGSSNFNFEIPVITLPGRGIDVSLELTYNSHIWHKSTDYWGSTHMTYDVDSGWPAPGFRLGYGQIEAQGSSGFTLVDPDGTRHQLVKLNPYNQYDYNYETTDGTFIRFYGGRGWGSVTYTDGTRIDYGAAGSGARSYPTRITDANGNYILISYAGGIGPRITSIQDTLGRYIRFYYDSASNLVAVTAPGYEGGGERQLIRFYYEDIALSHSFQAYVNAPATARVIRFVYYPGVRSGHRYDYSSYGMITRTTQLRGMDVNYLGLDQTGAISSQGQEAAWTEYNYPTGASNLADVPTFTRRTDDWAGRTIGMNGTMEAPYHTFSVNQSQGISTVTAPDGTVVETHTIVSPGAWNDGLISESIVKVGATILSRTVTEWETDANGRNARPRTVSVTNDAGQTKSTVYSYTSYNNISVISERGFDGVEIRRTETDHETRAEWVNRRLVRLPTSTRVVAGGAVASRIDYVYDTAGTNLTPRNDVIMHDPAFNPFAPTEEYCEWVQIENCSDPYMGCYYTWEWQCSSYNPYDPSTDKRGNLTSVTTYSDAASPSSGTTTTQTTAYDITGNKVSETTNCCQQKTYSYTVDNRNDYQYAYVTRETRGDAEQLTTRAAYDYNTGLVRSTTDENNKTTNIYYDAASLRHLQTNLPDGSYTYNRYNDTLVADPDQAHLHSYVFTGKYVGPGREVNAYEFQDGRGKPARLFNSTPDGYETIDIEYDVMGREYRKSNPYYSGGSGAPVTPSSGPWTTTQFDALGRTKALTTPDGNVATTDYAGNAVTMTDQAGRSRRSILDALGRTSRLDEPDDSGALGSVDAPARPTFYQYDALGNLVHITQGQQQRYFKYDSMGRITHERHPEQDAPHYAPDSLTGNSYWSRRLSYNAQGQVAEVYDARGVRTQHSYDGLNRVRETTYSDGTPTITYRYDQARGSYSNNGRLTEVVTSAEATQQTAEAYDYDLMGRVVNHRQTVGASLYQMSYAYDGLGQITSQTYPTGRVVSYGRDYAGRLTSIADGSRTYLSNASYGAHGALRFETWGNGAQHSIDFNNRLQVSRIDLLKDGYVVQRYDYKYGVVNSDTGAVDETKNTGQIALIEGSIGAPLMPPAKQWQQRYSYDALGRLTLFGDYRGDNGQLTLRAHYTYDRYGNRYQNGGLNYGLNYITVDGGHINQDNNRFVSTAQYQMVYDAAGNLTQDGKFRRMYFEYDANGRLRRAWRPNGDNSVRSVYDAGGQRVQVSSVDVTRHFVYDISGQLISEYGPNGWERDNIYRGGQILAVDEAPSSCWKSHEQFIRDTYAGALGRQPNGGELAEWLDRFARAQSRSTAELLSETQALADAIFLSSEYAARNTSNGQFVTDLYASYLHRSPDEGGYNFWLSVVNGNPSARESVRQGFAHSIEYMNNVNRICATSGTGGVRYVLTDHQGSRRVVMNESGAVVARHDYLPFGEEMWSGAGQRTAAQGYGSTDRVRQRYGETEWTEGTGLDHTLWREYDNWSGRWTTPDPLTASLDVNDPQSHNRYAYVGNDPVNAVDPLGLLMCFGYHVTLITMLDGRIIDSVYLGFIPVFCWDDTPIDTGGGGGGGGGGNPGGQTNIANTRNDFKNFLKTMSQDCKDALKNYMGRLNKLADSAKLYDYDTAIGNSPAYRFLGLGVAGNKRVTLGDFVDKKLGGYTNGAYTATGVRRRGIYFRGNNNPFAGEGGMYLLLHEMMHLVVAKGPDLDRSLANTLGIVRRNVGGQMETWSQSVSRYFNNKCNPSEKGK